MHPLRKTAIGSFRIIEGPTAVNRDRGQGGEPRPLRYLQMPETADRRHGRRRRQHERRYNAPTVIGAGYADILSPRRSRRPIIGAVTPTPREISLNMEHSLLNLGAWASKIRLSLRVCTCMDRVVSSVLSEYREKRFFLITGAFLTTSSFVGAVILHLAGKKFGVRLASDDFDIRVYFASARWVIEGGRLYREVGSEYPLLANVIFATLRFLAYLLHPGFYAFKGLWVASAWLVYLWCVYRIVKDIGIFVALAWLAPGPIYFALFRFDLYPAAATLMFLFAIRRTAYMEAAIWLGVAIAFKGYALFMLPTYCVFMVYQRGFTAAAKMGVVAVAPIILSLLVTLSFAGWEGVVAPFKLHAVRTLNDASTYDGINYLFGSPVISNGSAVRWIAQSLQVGCALAAAAMRPRSFEDLVNASLFAVLGFMSFSVFYSPQFVLWILPLVCFSGSRVHADLDDPLLLADLSLFPDQRSTARGATGPIQSGGRRDWHASLVYDVFGRSGKIQSIARLRDAT